ncbi:MAG: glycosyltransferase family 9 protein [Glaciecola sp.]|jgi:heptosyltransferase I
MSVLSRPYQKICILRLSAIGDVCHAVAMVTRIREAWPETQITWVIGKIEHELVKGMDGVRFIVVDKEAKQARARLKQALANEVFDVLLVMQVALRANWLSSAIKANKRLGFDWQRSKEGHWLFTNEHIQHHEQSHVLEGFMQFADALGVPPTNLRWDIPIAQTDEQWVQEKTAHLHRYVVLAPTASKTMRNWTVEGYCDALHYLQEQGFATVLCGGPGRLDRDMQSALHEAGAAITLDLVGQTTLKQMLVVLRQATFVIAPDTGPAHMATTVGTPVLGLYAHSNPLRTGPYCNLHDTVSVYPDAIKAEYNDCWQNLTFGVRAKGEQWMQHISTEQVRAAIDNFVHRL